MQKPEVGDEVETVLILSAEAAYDVGEKEYYSIWQAWQLSDRNIFIRKIRKGWLNGSLELGES